MTLFGPGIDLNGFIVPELSFLTICRLIGISDDTVSCARAPELPAHVDLASCDLDVTLTSDFSSGW